MSGTAPLSVDRSRLRAGRLVRLQAAMRTQGVEGCLPPGGMICVIGGASARRDPLPMMDGSRFDLASLPVRDILAKHPELAPTLAAHGLDACCGGMHPLKDACAARGKDLGAVMRDLEEARTRAEGVDLVPPTLSIRELVRRFPATRPVLERYGLGDCGGEDGPDEPLAWFATVHRLPLEEFLRDVRAAAAAAASAVSPTGPTGSVAAPAAKPFSPHFMIGSLVLTLTLGATTGMINLIRIAAGGEVPIDHRQIHGHTQLLGFAGLFLMGIAYHALPRILGLGGSRGGASVRAGFWLMAIGVLLRNAGQPLGMEASGRLLSLLSGALELASGLLFVRFVLELLGRAREGKYDLRDPILRFVRAGTIFFLVAMLLDAAQAVWLAGHAETALPAALTEPFYLAILYGFLLAWIYGFGHRVVSLFLGVGMPVRGTPEIALFTQIGGVVLALSSWLPILPDRLALGLRDGGLVLVALSALVYLGGNGFLWRRASLPMLRTPGSPTVAIRIAFSWLAAWALLELAAVVLSRTTALPAQNLWWADAARHAFTIGFLTLLIVGMSLRILPVFSGKTLWSPRLAYATYALLTAGASLRLLQYPAAFHPVLYQVGSYMGIPVVLALCLFALNLIRTMRAPTRARPVAPARFAVTPPASRPRAFVSTLPVR